ncbi:unnamed protein product [Enterobius vermicularis]|uniref:Signal recognition particle receptor subunit beta n=1 Tax=Enterobius vermicularis TaxID=51028 RepID=A0A0N4V3N0_ENTVE|nr:unnamed protein product [Enterobius vermicularis]
MPPKSKYVIVQLASVISGTTRMWIRERSAEKAQGIFFDPANLVPHTYTSLKENEFDSYSNVHGKTLKLVDFPGAERLRKQLFLRYFEKVEFKGNSLIKGVIFVIDSSTFSKKARDVAEFLYDVLRESPKGTFILIACNKQDIQLAKSSQGIRNALEREIGLINSSRSAALETTDGSSSRRILTTTGAYIYLTAGSVNFVSRFVKLVKNKRKSFQWTDLPQLKIDFLDCCADKEYQVEDGNVLSSDVIRNWINGIRI